MNMNMDTTIPSMEWYRVFHAVARFGSLSRAAEELHITQPAVSHTIKQLEAALGGKLFFRVPRGVKLTAEGELLHRHVEQAFGFIAAAERQLGEMHELRRGRVRIGAGDTLCKHYLLPHLARFHRTYPDIAIQVTNRTTPETVKLLKEGAIDFGIVNLPVDDRQIAIRESVAIRDCFVAGERYKELAAAPLPLARLTAYPLLMLEQGSSTRDYVDRFFREAGVALAPEIELGSLDLLVQFAQHGLGVACVIRNFAEEELASGALYEVALDPPIPPRRIGLVTLHGVPLAAAARRFMDMLP